MDKSKWEYKKLGEVCAPKSDILRANKLFGNDDIIDYVDISSIDNTTHSITQPTSYVFKEAPSRAQQKVEQGDILYSLVRPNLKNIAVVTLSDTDKYVASSGFCVLRGKDVETRYLYHMVLGDAFTNYILGLVSGANYPAVREDDVKGFSFRCPPIDDQQRIVAELDCLSEMIALKQEQLKEFDKLAQSIFYDMFGDGDWESRKIKDIAKVKIGPFGSSLHQFDYITGGTPLVNPIHMINGKIVVDNDFTITEEKKSELTSYLLKTNDIVFGRRGDIGRCALVTEKENGYLCGTGSLFVRFDIDIDPTYSLCELSSKEIKKYLLDNAKGATMLNLNGGIVENITIPLPPLALQQQFAEKIQAIEAQKELVKKSIAETQQLLDSRMDYYFN